MVRKRTTKMKTKNDVAGYKIDCSFYDPCPLCYGCKNFGRLTKCDWECSRDTKKNVCNNKLHNPRNFAKMLHRPDPIIIE